MFCSILKLSTFQPENIVLQSQQEKGTRIIDHGIKIIDFGTAKRVLPGQKVHSVEGNIIPISQGQMMIIISFLGTPEFMAPEVINFDEITCNTGARLYTILDKLSIL